MQDASKPSLLMRALNAIERGGNKLPDPAMIFLIAMLIIWGLSYIFSQMTFDAIDPRTG
ncbi:MAG: AbgT family transporter, partial [Kangiellaceae bacterium]